MLFKMPFTTMLDALKQWLKRWLYILTWWNHNKFFQPALTPFLSLSLFTLHKKLDNVQWRKFFFYFNVTGHWNVQFFLCCSQLQNCLFWVVKLLHSWQGCSMIFTYRCNRWRAKIKITIKIKRKKNVECLWSKWIFFLKNSFENLWLYA